LLFLKSKVDFISGIHRERPKPSVLCFVADFNERDRTIGPMRSIRHSAG